MLYECVECSRRISETAQSCPGCGTHDAGARAVDFHLRMEAIRSDPSYQERLLNERTEKEAKARAERQQQEAREAAAKAKSAKETLWLVVASTCIGGVLGGLAGWRSGSVFVAVIGILAGGFVGFFCGGLLIVLVFE
jgi:uncharacterized protein YcfJ